MTLQQQRASYDIDKLIETLTRMFTRRPPTGFVVGRTVVRDAVWQLLGVSELDAEEIVDTLILRGRLVFLRPPQEVGYWSFRQAIRC